jgi:RNA polymerase sigma factor (sigma-70 family)
VQNAPNETSGHGNGGIQGWEQTLAQYVVRDFIDERGLLPGVDRDDLVQEVLLWWVKQRQRYYKERGASMQTFFRKIARNRLSDIYREQRAEKRGSGITPSSLEEMVSQDDDDGAVLGDFVSDGRDMASETEAEVEREHILKLLTARQRELVLGLADGYSLADMARRMRSPRTTLADELNRIRRVLCRHGHGTNPT